MKKKLDFSYRLSASGFKVNVFKGVDFAVHFPGRIFSQLPQATKYFLVDNFIYSRTRALNLLDWQLSYQFGRPAWQNFIDFGLKKIIPCLGEINNFNIDKILKKFPLAESAKNLVFNGNQSVARLAGFKSLKDRAVLALSFGKDSILSYGLAKELGLNLLLATANEMENSSGNEWKIKSRIIKDFESEQGEQVYLFSDNVDELYYHPKINCHLSEVNNTNSLLAYALEFLPFVYQHRSAYLIFGNEQNLNDYFVNQQGFKFYPSFDQSSEYTAKENSLWSKASKGKFKVISLVEPLYNLGEFRVLYHRYPHLLKYVMSCEPDKGSAERWCYHCPMCAKAFLYSSAVGGDPKRIAFNKDFFAKKYSEHYPLFAKKKLRHYERPPQVREEQLLSFLLCYQQGLKGDLIDLFKKHYLAEAITKEKSLRKVYLGVHPAINLPGGLKTKIIKIFKEELKGLN
ncbi:MAG: hypothetical protein WCV73_03790 [Patescibacteria group bacterium]